MNLRKISILGLGTFIIILTIFINCSEEKKVEKTRGKLLTKEDLEKWEKVMKELTKLKKAKKIKLKSRTLLGLAIEIEEVDKKKKNEKVNKKENKTKRKKIIERVCEKHGLSLKEFRSICEGLGVAKSLIEANENEKIAANEKVPDELVPFARDEEKKNKPTPKERLEQKGKQNALLKRNYDEKAKKNLEFYKKNKEKIDKVWKEFVGVEF